MVSKVVRVFSVHPRTCCCWCLCCAFAADARCTCRWWVSLILGRLYLGVHSPTDIRGGIALGTAVAYGWFKAWPTFDAWIMRGGGDALHTYPPLLVAATLAVILVLHPQPGACVNMCVFVCVCACVRARTSPRRVQETRTIVCTRCACAGLPCSVDGGLRAGCRSTD